jgi:hypothetical protein
VVDLDPLELICEAIRSRKLLRFSYKNLPRVVEPHFLGLTREGRLELFAYLSRGFTRTDRQPYWRTFFVERILSLTVLEERFQGTRDGYNPDARRFLKVYCRLPRY